MIHKRRILQRDTFLGNPLQVKYNPPSMIQRTRETMEKYNVCWEECKASASNTFKNLLNDKDFTDVTLACEDGKQIQAHKVILSACTEFFKDILVKNPHTHTLLYLKGISHSQLTNLLKFAYLGETEVAQDCLEDFMKAAKELKIEGLSSFEPDEMTKVDEFDGLLLRTSIQILIKIKKA